MPVDVNTLPTSTHKVGFTVAALLSVTVIESIILEFTTTVASKAKALEGVVRVKITPAVVPFVGVPVVFNVALLSILTFSINNLPLFEFPLTPNIKGELLPIFK